MGMRYKCELCEIEFRRAGNRREHVKSVHEKIRFPCNMCQYQGTKKALTKHKQSVHQGIKFPCTICGHKASAKSSLNSHIVNTHKERRYFSCNSCSKQYRQKDSLSQHIRSVHEGNILNCKICPFKATYKSNLTRHIKSLHLEEQERYSCKICNYEATQKSDLSRHLKSVHENREKISCNDCNKVFQKLSLPQHMKVFHSGEKNIFFCKICSFNTIHSYGSQRHVKRVHQKIK